MKPVFHFKIVVVRYRAGEPSLLSEDGMENLQLRDSVLVDSHIDQLVKPVRPTQMQRVSHLTVKHHRDELSALYEALGLDFQLRHK